jgi:hypothetical protein
MINFYCKKNINTKQIQRKYMARPFLLRSYYNLQYMLTFLRRSCLIDLMIFNDWFTTIVSLTFYFIVSENNLYFPQNKYILRLYIYVS